MSGGPAPEIHSPNFGFLAKHDPLLVRYAAQAERYVFDDPNTALFKLRQFGELLAERACAATGVAVGRRDGQVEVLNALWDRRVINAEVSQLFHSLRKVGNEAVHGHGGSHIDDRREALFQLRIARRLAVWFHRSFGKVQNFQAGEFVPPPDPREAEQALHDELEQLRAILAAKQAEIDGVVQSAAEAARLRQEAERRAEEAFQELGAALELAEESEQQLAEERAEFEERLQELRTEVASTPAADVAATVAQAQQAAETLDLDEAEARKLIDRRLVEAGWEADSETLRHAKGARPQKGRNLAISEWPTANGPADYVLFAGLTPLAVIEAKKELTDVAAAIEQSKRYSRGYVVTPEQQSPGGPWGGYRVPFLFAANGRPFLRQLIEKSGTWFLDARRPTNHPRPLVQWHTPAGLAALLSRDEEAADARLAAEPLDYLPLRDYQKEAVRTVERAIAAGRRQLLVAMATGTGKTITCIGLIYRLIKAGRFRRVLFLVDRTALGEQAQDAFTEVRLENFQSFAEIYDVKRLGDLRPDADTRLHVATVQGMVQRLLHPADDAPPVPVDWYDCIVVDECHRGYNLDQEMTDAELTFRSEADYVSQYRRVLDHFDAVEIGLTATPALHTTEIFGPPVFEYSYRRAVIDGWLVDHEPPYRLVTALAEEGIHWQAGEEITVYDAQSQQLRLFATPDEVDVELDQFNRQVVTEPFNRAVCRALAEEIDPSRPGKALVFCVTDSHADMVVRLLKEAFAARYGSVEDDAVQKITGSADRPLERIRHYKNEQSPKVVVTVDLLTTGIDVPAITDLVFLRRVKSRILYEQMLGRATRLCKDLYGPGVPKTAFRIFDAVDLYSALKDHSQMTPVVTRPNIGLGQLVRELTEVPDEAFRRDVKDQLVGKLRRRRFSPHQAEQIATATGLSPEELIDFIRRSTPEEVADWFTKHSTALDLLTRRSGGGRDLLISEHPDELRRVERGYGTAAKPDDYIESFRRFVAEHADEIPALLVVTRRPRDLTRQQLRELRLALDQAGFTEANLRAAWRETTSRDVAASIVGYIRHVACGQSLVAHAERVRAAMAQILAGREWTAPQRTWLERIGQQLEQEVVVDRESLDRGQFQQMGGFARLNKIFKGELEAILHDIADAMWPTAA